MIDAAVLRELAEDLDAADHIRDQVHARLFQLLGIQQAAEDGVRSGPPAEPVGASSDESSAAGVSDPGDVPVHMPASAGAEADPLLCPDCGERFRSPQAKGAHRRYQHAARPLRTHDVPKATKFLCSRCGSSFLSREGRDVHETSHAEPENGLVPVGSARRSIGGVPIP